MGVYLSVQPDSWLGNTDARESALTQFLIFLHTLPKEPARPEDPIPLQVDAPLGWEALRKAYDIIPTIRSYGPFDEVVAGTLGRCGQVASVVCLALGLEYRTDVRLAQLASMEKKDGQAVRVYYPGHDNESWCEWQESGVTALRELAHARPGGRFLIITSRGQGAGIMAHTEGIADHDEIQKIGRSPEFAGGEPVHFLVEVDSTDKIILPPM